MAFQGKKRILYYIIQITSVLPLIGRTYYYKSQAEIGSYFKGTKTNFKVYRGSYLKGAL